MNSKHSFLFLATIILSLALLSFVSASDLNFALVSSPANVSHNQGSFQVFFNLTNTNLTYNATSLVFSGSSNLGASNFGSWTLLPTITLIQNNTVIPSLTATLTFPDTGSSQAQIISNITVNGLINGTAVQTTLIVPAITILPNPQLLNPMSVASVITRVHNSTTITLTNTGNVNLTNIVLAYTPINDSANKHVTLLFSENNFNLAAGQPKIVNINTTSFPSSFELGDYTSTINATSLQGVNATVSLTVSQSYCEFGSVGNLDVTKVSDTSSDDEWDWKPLDQVDVEVKVRNNDNDDLDVVIRLGLYNIDKKQFVDLGDDDFAEETESIDSDDTKTVTFKITVPADINGDDDYTLYVKAYEDDNEEKQCSDGITKDINIDQEDYEVIIKNMTVPNFINCGSSEQLTVKLYNIGGHDEERVRVTMFNTELGINQEQIIKNLDMGESKTLTFNVQIPSTAIAKDYRLGFNVDYNYDDGDDDYGDHADVFYQNLKVQGNCAASSLNVLITSEVTSEVKAGTVSTVKATIRNTGNESTTYVVAASGLDSWASLSSIDPITFTLAAGQSKDVLISFTPNADASGDKSFTITVAQNGQRKDQTVPVTVTGKSAGFSLTGSAIVENIKSNWFIWLIVLVNIILIVAIVIVAKRILSG